MSTTTDEEIPVIDAQLYLEKAQGWEEECSKVAYSFHKFGIVKLKDPRVDEQANNEYIDMVEQYFEEIGKRYYAGEHIKDFRPELCYQTGATPQGTERARDHQALIDSIPVEHKPQSVVPPVADAKWRFFWKIGDRPEEVQDDIPQTYPENFPQWEFQMDKWGYQMVNSTLIAAEMAAVGMGLDKDIFTSKMH